VSSKRPNPNPHPRPHPRWQAQTSHVGVAIFAVVLAVIAVIMQDPAGPLSACYDLSAQNYKMEMVYGELIYVHIDYINGDSSKTPWWQLTHMYWHVLMSW
jgi:hypothetical protein